MVDKVEDLVVPSASELGIGITPSKESERTADGKKQSSPSQLALQYGYSAQELRPAIDRLALIQVEEKFETLLTERSVLASNQVKKDVISPDNLTPQQLDEWKKQAAESLLSEILSYETVAQYRDVLTEEFIAAFNRDEQQFLKRARKVFDRYLDYEYKNITSLLHYFGYMDMTDFIEDILVKSSANSQLMVLREADPEIENVYRNGFTLHPMSELESNNPANAKMGKIYLAEDGSYLIRSLDRKTVYQGSLLDEDNLQLSDLSDLPSKMDNAFFKDRVLKILSNKKQISSCLVLCREEGFVFRRRVGDSLKEHAFRGGDRVQAFLKKLPAQSGFVEDEKTARMLMKDIVMIRPQLSEYKPPDMGILGRAIREKLNSQPERDFNQSALSFLERSKKAFDNRAPLLEELMAYSFVLNNMFAHYAGSTFLIDEYRKDLSHKFRQAVQNKQLDTELTQLSANKREALFQALYQEVDKLNDPEVSRAATELHFMAQKSTARLNCVRDKKTTFAVVPPKSVHRLSGMLGMTGVILAKVKSTVGGLKRNLSIHSKKVPFTDYAHTALHIVQNFQEIAKEHRNESRFDNSRFENLKFIYKRSNDKSEKKYVNRVPGRFFDGDVAEIYRKEELIFTAENFDTGVGVTVHSDEDRNIDLAVLVMVESLTKTGQKEICISLDLSASGADELVMKYVKAILAYKAIPVLLDGEKELSVGETKVKLEEMAKQINERGDNRYKYVAEQYDEQVRMIRHRQNEDVLFLKELEEHMERIEKSRGIFEEKLKVESSVESPEKYVPPLMQDPNSIDNLLTMAGVVARLGEMVVVDRNLTTDEFLNKVIECVQKVSGYRQGKLSEKDLANIKKDLRKTLDILITKHQGLPPEFIAATIFNLAAKKLKSDVWLSKEDIRPTKKQVDEVFIAAFNDFLRKVQTSSSSELIMKDPNPHTAEDLNITQILVRLAEITCAHKNMVPDVFVDKIVALTLALSGDAEQGVLLEQKEKVLKEVLQKEVFQYFDTPHEDRATIKEFVMKLKTVISDTLRETDRLVGAHLIQEERIDENSEEEDLALERSEQEIHLNDAASLSQVVSENGSNEESKIALNDETDESLLLVSERLTEDKVEDPSLSESLLSAQEDFSARVGVLYEKRADIERERRFQRALGAYALFHEAMKQKKFDLARSLMSDVAFLIEDAELMLKADEAQHSVKERTYVREIYNSLLQKASAELELDLDRQSAVASTESQESLEPFARNILVRDLQGQQLIEELLKEPAETTSPDEALERFLRESEPKEPSSSSQNVELTDEDRDYLAYLDDLTFIEAFDSLLQKATLAVGNHTVSMQDPNTGEDLNELQILVRLAKIALVDKTMSEEAFLERIIAFAFVSPKLASNVPLTPQKTEELKKELRSKFQGKEIDPEHIDELVSKLVKIARHEYSKGHTADEITGQHRDLYASAKATTVSSHHDDDGEGEARAPAMTHTH